MKVIMITIATLTILLVPIMAEQPAQPNTAPQKELTFQQALESGKPVMALFYTFNACHCTKTRCKNAFTMIDTILAKMDKNSFEYVKVDVSANRQLAKKI